MTAEERQILEERGDGSRRGGWFLEAMRVTGQVWVVILIKHSKTIFVWCSSMNPKILFALGTRKRQALKGVECSLSIHYLSIGLAHGSCALPTDWLLEGHAQRRERLGQR